MHIWSGALMWGSHRRFLKCPRCECCLRLVCEPFDPHKEYDLTYRLTRLCLILADSGALPIMNRANLRDPRRDLKMVALI